MTQPPGLRNTKLTHLAFQDLLGIHFISVTNKKPPHGGFVVEYVVGDTWIEHVTPAV